MILKRALLTCFAAAWLFAGAAPAYAQIPAPPAPPAPTAAKDEPATFAADEMTHDKELSTITARGNVEVNQNGRTLLADTITYDQTNDIIRATGNVALHRPGGDVYFADMMEISGDLKNGLIENFRAVMADRSRFAAQKGKLVNDETMTLDHAVYSPCQACQSDPSRPLLWQLKAVRIVHDRVGKVVKYKNAWLEFAGIPVMYTPYLSHPDPSVKRKSGLLPPRFGATNDMGMVIRTPYFQVIDDYSDITLTPLITTQENGALAGEYRSNFTKGEITALGSVAYDRRQTALAHINAVARFDVNDTWRWGADLQRATHDTYMRRYGYGNQVTLTSRGFVEGFRGNNYAAANVMAFQGLRATDDPRTMPVVMPLLEYNHRGEADRLGAYNTFDVNVAMLSRQVGASDERISLRPAWNLPYVAPKGDIYKLSASLGVDFFHAQNLTAPTVRGGTYNGAALRVQPQVALDWRWPLARRTGTVTEVLEPIGQVIVSPYGGNSWKMANEDSQEIDLNDTNLFSTNRFTGFDRVEGGPRANYGLKWGVYGDGGGSTSVLVGQSYRLKRDDTFNIGSGLENNRSDYVARLEVSPGQQLNLRYRTRIDERTLTFRRNEISASGAMGWFSYGTNYVFFDRQQNSQYKSRKELSYSFSAQATDFWSARLSGVRDLSQTGGQRTAVLGTTYEDECFRFDVDLSRSYFTDRNLKPNDSLMFRIVLKTLGEFSADYLPQ